MIIDQCNSRQLWAHWEITQGSLRDHSEITQGSFRDHSGIIQGSLRDQPENTLVAEHTHVCCAIGIFEMNDFSNQDHWEPCCYSSVRSPRPSIRWRSFLKNERTNVMGSVDTFGKVCKKNETANSGQAFLWPPPPSSTHPPTLKTNFLPSRFFLIPLFYDIGDLKIVAFSFTWWHGQRPAGTPSKTVGESNWELLLWVIKQESFNN